MIRHYQIIDAPDCLKSLKYLPTPYRVRTYFDEEYVFFVEYISFLPCTRLTGELVDSELTVYAKNAVEAFRLAEKFLEETYYSFIIRSIRNVGICKKPNRGTK